MTNEQQQVKKMMQMYQQDTPEKPTIPSLEVRKRMAKLILEEALETIAALGLHISIKDSYTGQAWIHDSNFDTVDIISISPEYEPNLLEIADGCEDLKVVTEGCLIGCGLVEQKSSKDIGPHTLSIAGVTTMHYNVDYHEDPMFNEVMRSNMSKLWTRKEWKELGEKQKDHTFSYDHYNDKEKCLVVKNKDGKFIKSPSYSPANLKQFIND